MDNLQNLNSIMTGVNDEYLGNLSGLNAGTYYYNYRYSANTAFMNMGGIALVVVDFGMAPHVNGGNCYYFSFSYPYSIL